MSWTTERVAMLRKLRGEGFSCSQIAARLGLVTRNAVVGKLHRLGIQANLQTMVGRPRKNRQHRLEASFAGNGRRAKQAMNKTTAAKKLSPAKAVLEDGQPLPPPQETDIARVSFADLKEHQCKWGVGDPKQSGFGFCGMDRAPGLPYCSHHTKRASGSWQPTYPSQAPSRAVSHVATKYARTDKEKFDRVDELLKVDA